MLQLPDEFVDPPDLSVSLAAKLRQIPDGRVTTYGSIATALGAVVASCWVATELLAHDHDENCLCHRVVRATGELGRYRTVDGGGQVERLQAAGICVRQGRVDLSRFGFFDFKGDRPLSRLHGFQEAWKPCVANTPPVPARPTVAGLDISYATRMWAVVACVTWRQASANPGRSWFQEGPVRFPYISSFLAFRELPLLYSLAAKVLGGDAPPDVLLVDGSGSLHPRSAGMAAVLGQLLEWPVIGVTKTRLCGELLPAEQDELGIPVAMDDRLAGYCMEPPSGSRHPMYVSPGFGLSVPRAAEIVRHVWGTRRSPDPIYWADRLSRQHARNLRDSATRGRHSASD